MVQQLTTSRSEATKEEKSSTESEDDITSQYAAVKLEVAQLQRQVSFVRSIHKPS